MRTLAAAALALALTPALCSAENAPKPASRRPTAGRAFFGLVIRHGRRLEGKLMTEPGMPLDRPYRVLDRNGSAAALDSSICLAIVVYKSSANDPSTPARVIDRGCTGLLASSTLDWRNHVPSPMTQSDLDAMYAKMTQFLFEK